MRGADLLDISRHQSLLAALLCQALPLYFLFLQHVSSEAEVPGYHAV